MRSAFTAVFVLGLFATGAAQEAGQIVQPTFPGAQRTTGAACVAGRHIDLVNLGVFGPGALITVNVNTVPTGGDIVGGLFHIEAGLDADDTRPLDVFWTSNDDGGGSLDPRNTIGPIPPNGTGSIWHAVALYNPSGTPVCFERRVQCSGPRCNGLTVVDP